MTDTKTIETLSETRCFGGRVGFYRHHSDANDCDMQFAVFVPPQAEAGPVPVVTFLSGLTCTEENFMVKSGAQRYAAELGLMLVSPDTSPRGDGVPDECLLVDPPVQDGVAKNRYVSLRPGAPVAADGADYRRRLVMHDDRLNTVSEA